MEPEFLLASTGGVVVWESDPTLDVYGKWSPALLKANAVASSSTKWDDNVQYVKGDGFISAAYRQCDDIYLDGSTLKGALLHLIELAKTHVQENATAANFAPPAGWLSAFLTVFKQQRRLQKEQQIKMSCGGSSQAKSKTKTWAESLKERFSVVKSYDSLPQMLQVVKENLQAKNVAHDAAVAISEAVQAKFEGSSRLALTHANLIDVCASVLVNVMTAASRRNLLEEVSRAKSAKRVYSIVVMGTNGVGKSTSLAKLAQYIKKHTGASIMIAACDTFRSGAIEQLRKHCNLLDLELFDRGYGTEPALVAQTALAKAAKQNTNVVLIDTAGRMQDNQPLMQALGKIVVGAKPDMLLFVGEALVGNDGLDQLMKFDHALKVSTAVAGTSPRSLDGIILTKFDTVDDKIGAAITMSFESQKPIMFVGTGQTYEDLRLLEPRDVAATLLS